MGKKKGIIAALVLVIVVGVVVWIWPHGEGPLYQGKHLSAWVKELPGKGSGTPGITWAPLVTKQSAGELAAVDAVQHIGTNALPFLMDEMRTKKLGAIEEAGALWNQLRDNFTRTFLHQQPITTMTTGIRYMTAAEWRHWDAARGLHALGPLARPTIPELGKILNQSDASPDAAYALAGMGTEGNAVLIQSLTNMNNWVGMCSMWAIGQTRTNTNAVAPLMEVLKDNRWDLRMAAIWSLGEIRAEPALVAPALATNLSDTQPNVYSMTELALAKYGIESLSARALTDYLKGPKLHVRMAATNALRVLHPKEAAEAGIK